MTVCFVRPSNKKHRRNRDGALDVGPCFRESDLTKGQTLCEQSVYPINTVYAGNLAKVLGIMRDDSQVIMTGCNSD